MQIMTKTVLAAAAGALVLAGTAVAGPKDVVKDERGNVILNTFGNCVRTKWEGGDSNCPGELGIEARTVYFEFASSRLTAAAKAKLDALVAAISKENGIESATMVGYADMIGSNSANQSLSMRRAKTVEKYLASKGLKVAHKAEVRALGEEAPVSKCDGMKGKELKACLWRDRRVEVELNYAN